MMNYATTLLNLCLRYIKISRIYSKEEIARIRVSGKILHETLEYVKEFLKPGVTTKKIDDLVFQRLKKLKAEPVFLGYHGYPASICISINEEIIHGIPDEKRLIKDGDIVSIDMGVRYNGYISDSSYTFGIGKVSPDADKIMKITYNALYKGIKSAVPGNRVGDIGYAVQSYVESNGYNVVRDFVGHGVGLELHEEPQVPNYGRKGTGKRLKPGMVIAIEPMVTQGTYEVIVLDNGWTAVTADGKLSAHYEHTVAITDDGPQILTM